MKSKNIVPLMVGVIYFILRGMIEFSARGPTQIPSPEINGSIILRTNDFHDALIWKPFGIVQKLRLNEDAEALSFSVTNSSITLNFTKIALSHREFHQFKEWQEWKRWSASATNSYNTTFIGISAGYFATNAVESIFIGVHRK